MPRRSLAQVGPHVWHAMNRAVQHGTLFSQPSDYTEFLALLGDAAQHHPISLFAYCAMPNHLASSRTCARGSVALFISSVAGRRARQSIEEVVAHDWTGCSLSRPLPCSSGGSRPIVRACLPLHRAESRAGWPRDSRRRVVMVERRSRPRRREAAIGRVADCSTITLDRTARFPARGSSRRPYKTQHDPWSAVWLQGVARGPLRRSRQCRSIEGLA